jgi:hypothetical protein
MEFGMPELITIYEKGLKGADDLFTFKNPTTDQMGWAVNAVKKPHKSQQDIPADDTPPASDRQSCRTNNDKSPGGVSYSNFRKTPMAESDCRG